MNRLQRKRSKGFKLPPNTKCVTRGTKWGNPIKLVGDMIYVDASYRRKILDPWVYYGPGNIDDVIYLFELILKGFAFKDPDLQYWSDKFKELDMRELLEYDNLACFCSLDSKCHADSYIKLLK